MRTRLKFNANTFGREWVALRISRWLKNNIFDPLGHENLRYLIESNQSFIKRIPPEVLAKYKALPQAEIDKYSQEDIYSWIPVEYRKTIEALPNGKEWALTEVKGIVTTPHD